jgi:hypothetical protein
VDINGQLHTPPALPDYPLESRLSGSQTWFECPGEEKNLLPLLEIESQFFHSLAHGLVTIPVELLWLPLPAAVLLPPPPPPPPPPPQELYMLNETLKSLN